MILVSNEAEKHPRVHFEIMEIEDNFVVFKAVSPLNQGLPFGSRFLADLLTNRSGGHYEVTVLGEGTISERILSRYINAESSH